MTLKKNLEDFLENGFILSLKPFIGTLWEVYGSPVRLPGTFQVNDTPFWKERDFGGG